MVHGTVGACLRKFDVLIQRWVCGEISHPTKKNPYPREIPIPKNPGDKKSLKNPQSQGFRNSHARDWRFFGDFDWGFFGNFSASIISNPCPRDCGFFGDFYLGFLGIPNPLFPSPGTFDLARKPHPQKIPPLSHPC